MQLVVVEAVDRQILREIQ